MKGLSLCESYYQVVGAPAFAEAFPDAVSRMAFGLCGEGSECFGFDDEYSRDHDFGPSFCVWMTDEDYDAFGEEASRIYQNLPTSHLGVPARRVTSQGGGRVGVMRISDFYRKFTGCPKGPQKNLEWFYIPEHLLAQAVNGKVFRDDSGEFTSIRNRLLAFYPEEVRRKKLAARAVTMAQAGQYNYPRSMKRNDPGASFQAMSEFVKAAISMAHLLERRYTPYYKWSYRSLQSLHLHQDKLPALRHMLEQPLDPANIQAVEDICIRVKEEWMRQGLTSLDENFLEPQGWELFRQIADPDLKRMSILQG